MKRPTPTEAWPESWKMSYRFDLLEVYDEPSSLGYVYAYQVRKQEAIRLITQIVKPPAHILDVAAAQGNFSLALAEMGYSVTWNDLRAELADYVKLKHETGSITFAAGDAFGLDFPQPFDAVLATEIIEHVAHPDEFLAKLAKLVRPGGYIVMTTPNGAYFRNTLPKFSDCPDTSVYESVQFQPDGDGHIFLLHPSEIGPIADRAGLAIDSLSLFTNTLTRGHMKTEAVLHALPRSVVGAIESFTQSMPFTIKEKLSLHMAIRFRKY